MSARTLSRQQNDHKQLLGSVSLFNYLSDSSIDQLAAGSRNLVVHDGEYLFFRGDEAHSIYVVNRGWLVIMLSGHSGQELVLSEMRRGDVFGENAVLTGFPRSATAIAREESQLVEIAGEVFLAVLDNEPQLARRLLVLAARRLAASNEREAALAFLPAAARLVRVLRQLDDLDRATRDKGYLTVSQEELAQRTGLTRQTVARLLGDWRRNGWLLTGRGRIMLLNRVSLYTLEEEVLG